MTDGRTRAPRSPFELNVLLPTDSRFAGTVRELAVHAAKHAGCSDEGAHAFGDRVEQALRPHLQPGGAAASVPLVLRRTTDSVEVLVNGRPLAVDP
jgi:hypothetical protein